MGEEGWGWGGKNVMKKKKEIEAGEVEGGVI